MPLNFSSSLAGNSGEDPSMGRAHGTAPVTKLTSGSTIALGPERGNLSSSVRTFGSSCPVLRRYQQQHREEKMAGVTVQQRVPAERTAWVISRVCNARRAHWHAPVGSGRVNRFRFWKLMSAPGWACLVKLIAHVGKLSENVHFLAHIPAEHSQMELVAADNIAFKKSSHWEPSFHNLVPG